MALLAWGLIFAPWLLVFVLLVDLFVPRKHLLLADCFFISLAASQTFTSFFVFFFGGFLLGTVNDTRLLSAFVLGCIALSLYILHRRRGAHALREAFLQVGQTGFDPALWIISVSSCAFFYQTFLSHYLFPLRSAEAKDIYSLVEAPAGDSGAVQGYMAQGATWSDLPFHLGIINSFRFGGNSKDFSPLAVMSFLFSKTELAFSLLPDVHAALLCAAGFQLREALVIPSTLLSTSTIALLFIFARKFCVTSKISINSVRALVTALLAVLLLVFAGGLGGFPLIAEAWKNYREAAKEDPQGPLFDLLWRAIERPLIETDHIQTFGPGGKELYWFSFIYHMLIPQRCPVYAYPLFLSTVILLWAALQARGVVEKTPKKAPSSEETETENAAELESLAGKARILRKDIKRLFGWAGLIGALTPLAQSFTFTAIWAFSLLLFALEFPKWLFDSFYLFHWIGFFVPLFAMGYLQVAAVLIRPSLFQDWGSLNFKLLWTDDLTDVLSFFSWWFYSLGLFVYVFFYSGSYMHGLRFKFYLSAAVLFIFGNIFQLGVWNRDNIKFFYCWHFLASVSVAYALVQLMFPSQGKKSNDESAVREERVFLILKRLFVLILVVCLIFSGLLMAIREPHHNYKLFSAEDMEAAQWIRDNTPHDAVFLTSESHQQPATSLAGRSQVTTFNGWMWSHGYTSKPRQDRILRMLACSTPRFIRAMMKKYGIGYVIVDEKLRTEWADAIHQYIFNPPGPLEAVEGEELDRPEELIADGWPPISMEDEDEMVKPPSEEESDYLDDDEEEEEEEEEVDELVEDDEDFDELKSEDENEIEEDEIEDGDLSDDEDVPPLEEPKEEVEEGDDELRKEKKRLRAEKEKKEREMLLALPKEEQKAFKLSQGIFGCTKATFISVFKNSAYEILQVDLQAFVEDEGQNSTISETEVSSSHSPTPQNEAAPIPNADTTHSSAYTFSMAPSLPPALVEGAKEAQRLAEGEDEEKEEEVIVYTDEPDPVWELLESPELATRL